MAITATSAVTISQSLWQQLQLQQVQQAATQAQQNARALQEQASDARAAANRAQETARQLEIKASQAQQTANQAVQNVVLTQLSPRYQAQLGNASSLIAQGVQNAQVRLGIQPVSNAQGATAGSVINITV